jgi:membrane protease YdiL (CAAX protease family)
VYKGRVSRVLIYYLAMALGAFGGTLLTSILVPASLPAPYAWLIRAATVMAAVVGITHAFLVRAGRRWSEFAGSGRPGATLAKGALGGVLLAVGWLAVIFWLSPYELGWNRGLVASQFLAASLGTVAMGIAEEVGYRSFGLLETRRIAGNGAAIALSTAVFVAAHVAGGVPWPAALLVVGSASVLFAVLMLETRNLPLVIALHVATNLVQDNTLRGSAAASLFSARAVSPAAADHEIAIWGAMAAMNLAAAAVVFASVRRPSAS